MGIAKTLVPILLALFLCSPAWAQIGQSPDRGMGRRPPREAFEACTGKSQGQSCFLPYGMSGTCRPHQRDLVCIPDSHSRNRDSGPSMGRRPGRATDQNRGVSMSGMDRGRQQGPMMAHKEQFQYPDDSRYARFKVTDPVPTAGRVPDTDQQYCFDEQGVIPCPNQGQELYGQDAQYKGPGPSYTDNGDGTVTDRVTGLTWEKAHHDSRIDYYQAKSSCNGLTLGGRSDWRLPSIKELYSLILFHGSQGGRFYLDEALDMAVPDDSFMRNDPVSTHHADMMGQTWTSTIYQGKHWDRDTEAAFFVNFLDGRIKQAPTRGRQGLFYRCVRGPEWGENDFHDNGDGTVTDRAVGLMWQQADDGRARDWPEALAYCESLELAGHSNWRLPNAKELEYIVDYTRPQPALDTEFLRISDPKGWFWSSTTHGDKITDAAYVCFGKCTSAEGVDVHGAGAQRSDPKTAAVKMEASRGGQNDEVRGRNYVRCVRDVD